MEIITLTEDLEVGKRTIVERGKPTQVVYEFFAYKGEIIQKIDGEICAIPIGEDKCRYNNLTKTIEHYFDDYLGKIVWQQALKCGSLTKN